MPFFAEFVFIEIDFVMQRLKSIIEYEKLGLTDRVFIRMGYNSVCYEELSS